MNAAIQEFEQKIERKLEKERHPAKNAQTLLGDLRNAYATWAKYVSLATEHIDRFKKRRYDLECEVNYREELCIVIDGPWDLYADWTDAPPTIIVRTECKYKDVDPSISMLDDEKSIVIGPDTLVRVLCSVEKHLYYKAVANLPVDWESMSDDDVSDLVRKILEPHVKSLWREKFPNIEAGETPQCDSNGDCWYCGEMERVAGASTFVIAASNCWDEARYCDVCYENGFGADVEFGIIQCIVDMILEDKNEEEDPQ